MTIIILIVVYMFIAYLELPNLIEKNYEKEAVVFLFILSVAFLISIIESLTPVPNPLNFIIYIFKDLLHLYYSPINTS